MSLMPCLFNKLTMCCIIGLFIIGTIGFGMLHVRGRSLVPNPPDMMTAFIGVRCLDRKKDSTLMKNSTNKKLGLQPGSVAVLGIVEHLFKLLVRRFNIS